MELELAGFEAESCQAMRRPSLLRQPLTRREAAASLARLRSALRECRRRAAAADRIAVAGSILGVRGTTGSAIDQAGPSVVALDLRRLTAHGNQCEKANEDDPRQTRHSAIMT